MWKAVLTDHVLYDVYAEVFVDHRAQPYAASAKHLEHVRVWRVDSKLDAVLGSEVGAS